MQIPTSLHPKPRKEFFHINVDFLGSAEKTYNDLTGRALFSQIASAQRQISSGNESIAKLKYPFAWSVIHLKKKDGLLMPSGQHNVPDLAAFMNLITFMDVVEKWKHHPNFFNIMGELRDGGTFYHMIGYFITAGYLFEHNNTIGLAVPKGGGVPTADLYAHLGAREKLHIEVKAPQACSWTAWGVPNIVALSNILKASLKSSGHQINRENKGVLAVFSSCFDETMPGRMEDALERVIRLKGKDHVGMAAISGIVPQIRYNYFSKNFGINYKFFVKLNPYYNGLNPINPALKDINS